MTTRVLFLALADLTAALADLAAALTALVARLDVVLDTVVDEGIHDQEETPDG